MALSSPAATAASTAETVEADAAATDHCQARPAAIQPNRKTGNGTGREPVERHFFPGCLCPPSQNNASVTSGAAGVHHHIVMVSK